MLTQPMLDAIVSMKCLASLHLELDSIGHEYEFPSFTGLETMLHLQQMTLVSMDCLFPQDLLALAQGMVEKGNLRKYQIADASSVTMNEEGGLLQ